MSPSQLYWWMHLSEPDTVKAVLSAAYLRDGAIDVVHDSAAKAFGPHAATVVELAGQLEWIERLEVEPPGEVLAAYYVDHPLPSYSIGDAEWLRDELRGRALVSARDVAGLARIDGRAA